jgi:hypothetical protein
VAQFNASADPDDCGGTIELDLKLPDVCLTADLDVNAKVSGLNGKPNWNVAQFNASTDPDDCGGTIELDLSLPDVCLTADMDVTTSVTGPSGTALSGQFIPSSSKDDCGGTIDLDLTIPDFCTSADITVTTSVSGMNCPTGAPAFNATVTPQKGTPEQCGTDIQLDLTLPDVCSSADMQANAKVTGSTGFTLSAAFTPTKAAGLGCGDCGATLDLDLGVPFVCESFSVDSSGLSISGPGNNSLTFSSSVSTSGNECKLTVGGGICIPTVTTSSSVSISGPLTGSLSLVATPSGNCDVNIDLSGSLGISTTQC